MQAISSPDLESNEPRSMKRFFKQRRMRQTVARHLAEHGGFEFFGRRVATPPDLRLSIQCQIADGSYERAEAALIDRYIPRDLPVVELGGCLGLISGYLAARLSPDVDLVVVEANPALIDCCRHNATHGGERQRSQVVHAAIAYGQDHVQFEVSDNVHVNRVGSAAGGGVSVPTTTLASLLSTISTPSGYALICDIEGHEVALLENDAEALRGCRAAVVELHPHMYEAMGTSLEKVLALAAGVGLEPVASDDNVYALVRRPRG